MPRPVSDLVADGAHGIDPLPGRVIDFPIQVSLAGEVGLPSPQPMVMATLEAPESSGSPWRGVPRPWSAWPGWRWMTDDPVGSVRQATARHEWFVCQNPDSLGGSIARWGLGAGRFGCGRESAGEELTGAGEVQNSAHRVLGADDPEGRAGLQDCCPAAQ